VHCGGSGCGCSASVICGHILKRLERGELKNVLYLATGALMSPSSLKQGATIPGIAHLVHFSAEKPGEEK
jgi:stage V sporulation protein AD